MSNHLEVSDLMGEVAKLRSALEQTSAILSATVTAGRLSEGDEFNFTGRWQRLGRIRVGKVLDLANAALALPSADRATVGGEK